MIYFVLFLYENNNKSPKFKSVNCTYCYDSLAFCATKNKFLRVTYTAIYINIFLNRDRGVHVLIL